MQTAIGGIFVHEFFNQSDQTLEVRDPSGVVRGIIYQNQPFRSDGHTPQEVALDFLTTQAAKFRLPEGSLVRLNEPPNNQLSDASVEFRLSEEKTVMDLTTLGYVGFAQKVGGGH